MPTLGPIRYAEIRYASTIDPIPDLFARIAYPEGNRCPVVVGMHGLPGGASTFQRNTLLRWASYGFFVVMPGMRGRDGASGSQDLSNRELQDILDAVATVRSQYVEASPQFAAFVGYSAGGSNVLCLAGRHPTAFQVCVDHFGITDYATWWSESPANQSLLNTWVGGTPAQVPAAYTSRSPLLNLETFTGRFFFFHDQSDATVNVHHTTDAVAYLQSKGVTPQVSYTSSSDAVRWLHALPNDDQPVRFTEAIWVPAVQELAMGHVDRTTELTLSDGTPVDDAHPLPTTAVANISTANFTPTKGSFTDRSGTITSGGTAQQLAASNGSRTYLLVQNNSTADLWINFTNTAVANQPSIKIPAGAIYTSDPQFVSTEAVSIFGATTGQAFTAKEG